MRIEFILMMLFNGESWLRRKWRKGFFLFDSTVFAGEVKVRVVWEREDRLCVSYTPPRCLPFFLQPSGWIQTSPKWSGCIVWKWKLDLWVRALFIHVCLWFCSRPAVLGLIMMCNNWHIWAASCALFVVTVGGQYLCWLWCAYGIVVSESERTTTLLLLMITVNVRYL